MAFKLEIITLTRQFFSAMAEAVTVTCTDGELTVLSGHAPLVAAMANGSLKIKENGTWRTAFHAEGFLDVRPDEVLIFVQTCEWPEEVDVARENSAKERALEKMRQQHSIVDHQNTKISLARAMTRLQMSKKGTRKL